MNPLKALIDLDLHARGNDRLQALKENDSPELRKALNYALSPDITFGIKALPEPKLASGLPFDDDDWWWNTLQPLLDRLAARDLTGDAAKDEVAYFLGKCDEMQCLWSERILRQDLRLDLGAKDVNKTLGAGTIRIFAVPLATAVFDSERQPKLREKDLKGLWMVQAKCDGGRAVSILPAHGGEVVMLSRTGKIWGNFESVRRVLQAWNNARNGDDAIILDGEVVSVDENGRIDFQNIQKTMMRKDGVEVGRLEYLVFDACLEEEWYKPTQTYRSRWDRVRFVVPGIGSNRIKVMPTFDSVLNPTFDDLLKMGEEFVEKGYEGLILRRPDDPVENKRGKKLLKVKLFDDAEAEIIGVNPGAAHTKNEYTLGALVCRMKNGVVVEVGGGFNPDSYRDVLWGRREEIIGQICNFAFFGLSKDGVPRHPQFRGIRAPEDCE